MDREEAKRIARDFQSPRLDLGDDSIEPTAVDLRYNVLEGDPRRNIAVFEMIQSYVLAWPEIKVLNRASMTDANNTSKNLRLAREIGLEIPDTIVLGDLTPLGSIPDPDQRAIPTAQWWSTHRCCR